MIEYCPDLKTHPERGTYPMLKLYTEAASRRIIKRCAPLIRASSVKYGVPEGWIRAILFRELTEIDLLDLAADFAVRFYYFRYRLFRRLPSGSGFFGKKDSSTGYSQIFAFVAIDAANFALDRGITDYAGMGICSDHRLDRYSPDDIWMIWRKLNRDKGFNIEMATLNLLSAAQEMTGRMDCPAFSPEETKLCFTRYNADVRHITTYGEQAYRYYLDFQGQAL